MSKMEEEAEKLQMNSVEYTLVVDNFRKQTNPICSPNFLSQGSKYGENFSLVIFPSSPDLDFKIGFECSQIDLEMRLKCIVSILNANEEKFYQKEIQRDVKQRTILGELRPEYITEKLISRAVLMKSRLNYLPNDKFSIHCEIFYSINLATTIESKKNYKSVLKLSKLTVLENYSNLLRSGKFSDAIFVVGEKEFHVHKNILATQSPVFSAMFDYNHKENQECRFEITDINSQVMEYLLMYIYTGKAMVMDYCALDLLVAAEKYQLEYLRLLCTQVVLSTLPGSGQDRDGRLFEMLYNKKYKNLALKH